MHQTFVLTTSTKTGVSGVKTPKCLIDAHLKQQLLYEPRNRAGELLTQKYNLIEQLKVDRKAVDKFC